MVQLPDLRTTENVHPTQNRGRFYIPICFLWIPGLCSMGPIEFFQFQQVSIPVDSAVQPPGNCRYLILKHPAFQRDRAAVHLDDFSMLAASL